MSMKVKPGQYTLKTMLQFAAVRVNARKRVVSCDTELGELVSTLMKGGVILPVMHCITNRPAYASHLAYLARCIHEEREEMLKKCSMNAIRLSVVLDNYKLLDNLTEKNPLFKPASDVFDCVIGRYENSDQISIEERPDSFTRLIRLYIVDKPSFDKIYEYILRRL